MSTKKKKSTSKAVGQRGSGDIPVSKAKTKSFEERTKNFELDDWLEAEKVVFDLRQLLNIAKVLSSTLEVREVLDRIVYSCFGQFQVEKAAIFLNKDFDEQKFVIEVQRGYESEDISLELKSNGPLLNFIKENPLTVRHEELIDVTGLKRELNKLSVLEPLIYTPFRNKNDINGLLVLGEKLTGEEYTDDELDFLTTLSGFAGLAVANAKFFQLAISDRMTRLFHNHYFKEKLKEEIEKASEDFPLTLIMFDIDHFKKFNDNYGHQQGDVILIELANIIRKEVKNNYTAARYGGEEFTIIMPNTEIEDGFDFAESLRKKIERKRFPGKNNKKLKVTASFGVAQYELGEHNEVFIHKVDSALYKSKAEGRNIVTQYSDELADFMDNKNK